MNSVLAWIGAAAGVLGAVLLSLNISISAYGYLLFMVSSLCLTVWARREKQNHQLMMQLVFTIINVNGCIQWLS